jgi:hypothetical protein
MTVVSTDFTLVGASEAKASTKSLAEAARTVGDGREAANSRAKTADEQGKWDMVAWLEIQELGRIWLAISPRRLG